MKKRLTNSKRLIFGILVLMIFSFKAHSQTPDSTYNCYIKNINFVNCRTLEFEVWLEYTGNVDNKFQFFQAGVNFNYAGLANGGVLTGAIVAGSADASLPSNQRSPSWSIQQTSKQIRMIAQIAGESAAVPIPPAPGLRLGKFKINNTVDFADGSTPNFVWSFPTGLNITATKIGFYFAGATLGNDVTKQARHFVESNPAAACGAACAITASIGPNLAPPCLGGTNGSATVTIANGTNLSTGTYVLDGAPAVPYATNPFTISNLSEGPHSVVVTTAAQCSTTVVQFNTALGADKNDNNLCTEDFCNSITGVSHTPIPIIPDGDACTTDGCNSLTGAPIYPSNPIVPDGNACTTDGCNTLTGAPAYTPNPIVPDGNACTTDGCNTLTGAPAYTANPVAPDGNACTTDGCNSLNGEPVYTTNPIIPDGNACTTDGCNTLTGAPAYTPNPIVPDGNACTTDGCNSLTGAPAYTPNPIVPDGNACTTDACNTTTGAPVYTTNPIVPDGNACTTDGCNTLTGAPAYTANPVAPDGNACTTDGCNSLTGAPVYTTNPIVPDGNACTTDGCNTLTGAPSYTANPVVPDGNACTTDGCNSLTGAPVYTANPIVPDGNACTTDGCNTLTGAPVYTTNPIVPDGNACTTDGCNTLTGAPKYTANPVVPDGNACTTDGCNSLTGAPVYTANPIVPDGNACTTDGCNTLTGAPVYTANPIVPDGNACTTDGCNTLTGAPKYTANPVAPDGNACTTDGCNSLTGAPVYTPNPIVPDGNVCTIDGCNTLTGAPVYTPIGGCGCPIANPGGPYSSCGNVLLNGSITNATTGTWSSTTGGTFLPNATTLNATYVPSATDLNLGQTTLKLTTNDPVGECTAEFSTVLVTITRTNDNNACTIDACNTLTGLVSHIPVNIDDGDPCTSDACNTLTGVSHISKITIGTSTTPAGCTTSDGSATATPSGGTPEYNYSWSPGGQTTNPATGLAGGNYVVTVTDNNGCSTTASAVVGVTGSSTNPPGPISGPAGACRGQKGVVYCIEPVDGATSYIWTVPRGSSGSSSGTCITVKFSSSYNGGYVCVRAVTPCGISPSVCIKVPRIKEAPSKPGPITGPISLCPNTDGPYAISPVEGATSYVWATTGGLVIISGQGSTLVIVRAPAGFTKGTVKVKSKNCKGSSSSRVINVYGEPAIPVWYEADRYDNEVTEICGGSTHEYEIKRNPGSTCYIWTAPQGAIINDRAGHTGNPLTVDGSVDDVDITFPEGFISGYVTVSACNACGTSSTAELFVSSIPSTPIWKTPPPITACPGKCYIFNVDAVQDADSWTYTAPPGSTITSWGGTGSGNPLTTTVSKANICFPRGFVSGEIRIVSRNKCGFSEPLIYQINACEVSGASTTINTANQNNKIAANGNISAINISEALSSLTVYPNPTNGKTSVTFYSSKKAKYSIKVLDIIGKVMINENIPAVEGYNVKEINLENISKGLYLISIQTEGGTVQTLRLVVE